MPTGITHNLSLFVSLVVWQLPNNMEDHYPKYQWSFFAGQGRAEQYVVRAETMKELLKGISEVKAEIEKPALEDEKHDEEVKSFQPRLWLLTRRRSNELNSSKI